MIGYPAMVIINFFRFGSMTLESLYICMQLISAADRHRQSTDHPIKFILRRPPYTLKFKIKPGLHIKCYSPSNKTVHFDFLLPKFTPISYSATIWNQKFIILYNSVKSLKHKYIISYVYANNLLCHKCLIGDFCEIV